VSEAADLVLRNGTIATVDSARPEAEALAVRGETILAVGSDAEIAPLVGPSTEVIDLEGGLAVPGFIEGHAHLIELGKARMQLDLRGARNWAEIIGLVAAAARGAEPGAWVLGRGWHQDKWNEAPAPSVGGFPVHHSLSNSSPGNPVLLRHACGHASFANAVAMERAGVTRATPAPPGGAIVRDAHGQPTGAFLEAAQETVGAPLRRDLERRSPQQLEADTRRQIELAATDCLANGITSLHDAGAGFDTIGVYRKLADEGRLPIRLWAMVGEPDERIAEALPDARIIGYGGAKLTVRAIKRLIDGALGARGAWMLEPYADSPANLGLCLTPPESIAASARLAIDNGLQLCVHAIGDRANREVLDIFEATFKAHPNTKDLRWRIEHAQHLHPDDIGRFARLGVIASMQGNHCTGDGPFATTALGESRARLGAYAWQSLLRAGAIVVNGTDAPVEDIRPLSSFYASVARKLPDGSRFCPHQSMTRQQALRSYTRDAAFAAFEDHLKGSLTPGKLADITALSKNILTIPEDEIPAAEVLCTLVGGRIAFRRGTPTWTPSA
jgi:predicted amidohydrolase YtcJ